jgi:hypothetical protein
MIPGQTDFENPHASHGSIFLHSFLASRLACFGKLFGDFIADAEEDLVGSLPLECRMRHYSEALLGSYTSSPPVVGFDAALDERMKGREAVQRIVAYAPLAAKPLRVFSDE